MLDVCWQFRTTILERGSKNICGSPFKKNPERQLTSHSVSLWNMADIFICKWVKQRMELGFNSNTILERLHKRQDKPVSSGSCDLSAPCLQPLRQAWLSCSALNLNGKERWRLKQDIVGDSKGRLGEDRRKKRADVDRWHWRVRARRGDVLKTTEGKWDVWNGKKHLSRTKKALRVLWSERYSPFQPVCYVLSCGSIVLIVVEELSLPGGQKKSRSSLLSVNREDNTSRSLSHTIMIHLTSIFIS